MANEKILLKAEANKLGIDGYRTMSVEELQDAIKRAKGTGSAPAKGKGKTAASTNGSAPAKGKTTASKGKTSSAPAKGKSTTQKSTPAKGKASAAKGKASRAATTSTAKGKGKTSTPAKGKATAAKTAKATPAKGKASTTAKKTTTRKASAPARVDIDRSQIDWRAESNVGKTGKRAEVMAALRKHKGNYDKCFDTLQDRARKFYPGKTKHEAERMLRWLINRVAFDFVMSTEQHTPGERAAYGTSEKPQDIRRRERREAAAAEAAKAERAAKRAKGKAPAKKAPAKKGKGKK